MALATVILDHLQTFRLDLSRLRGQGYDRANNMAESLAGCAAKISEQYPKAVYAHFSSHALNLAPGSIL